METLTDRPVLAEPRPPKRRRHRRIVLVCAGVLLVVLADAWLVWQSHENRLPAPVAAAVPVPVPQASVTSAYAPPRATTSSAPQPAGLVSPAMPTVDPAWVSSMSLRTTIPARALSAYANAQLATAVTQPNCHVTWTMLAGIGTVESSNGRSGGSVLEPDGTTSRTILGPALDGTHGDIAVPATAAGIRLDGDVKWDHAVGPMQFIPSTWLHWGTSADGGIANPNDIDDAALTAARYLCAGGRDLSTPQGWRAAVGSYNAPAAYAAHVTELADTYARESES